MYSYSEQVAAGDTTVFPVPFKYIRRAHVSVLVNGSPTPFSWLSDQTIAVAGEASDLAGKRLVIQRVTPGQSALVQWTSGGIDPGDLTLSDLQLLYLFQEAADAAKRALNLGGLGLGFDFRGYRGINAADPVDPQDVATRAFVQQVVAQVLVSPGTFSASAFAAFLATRPFLPADDAQVPAEGAWYRTGSPAAWSPVFATRLP